MPILPVQDLLDPTETPTILAADVDYILVISKDGKVERVAKVDISGKIDQINVNDVPQEIVDKVVNLLVIFNTEKGAPLGVGTLDANSKQPDLQVNPGVNTKLTDNATQIGANVTQIEENRNQLLFRQLVSEKGQINGYAGLDHLGYVPLVNLNPSLTQLKGNWNALTNTVENPKPNEQTSLTNPPTALQEGWTYDVSVAGTQFDPPITFGIGDQVVGTDNGWSRKPNVADVVSFNQRTGAITLISQDVIDSGYGNVVDVKIATAIEPLQPKLTPIAGIVMDGANIGADFGIEPTQVLNKETADGIYQPINVSPIINNASEFQYILYKSDGLYPEIDQTKIGVLDGRIVPSIVSGIDNILYTKGLVKRDNLNNWRRSKMIHVGIPSIYLAGSDEAFNISNPLRMRQHGLGSIETGLGNLYPDINGVIHYDMYTIRSADQVTQGAHAIFTYIFPEGYKFTGSYWEIENLTIGTTYNAGNGWIGGKIWGDLEFKTELINNNAVQITVTMPPDPDIPNDYVYCRCDMLGSGSIIEAYKTVLTYNTEAKDITNVVNISEESRIREIQTSGGYIERLTIKLN